MVNELDVVNDERNSSCEMICSICSYVNSVLFCFFLRIESYWAFVALLLSKWKKKGQQGNDHLYLAEIWKFFCFFFLRDNECVFVNLYTNTVHFFHYPVNMWASGNSRCDEMDDKFEFRIITNIIHLTKVLTVPENS